MPRFFTFFFVLLIVFFIVDWNMVVFFLQKAHQFNWLLLSVFIFLYLGLITSAVIFFSIKSKIVRWLFIIFSFISFSISIGTRTAHSAFFGINEATTILEEFEFVNEAFQTFLPQYLMAIGISIILVWSLSFFAKYSLQKISNYFLAIPFITIAATTIFIFKTQAILVNFPSVFNVPMLTFYVYKTLPFGQKRNEPFLTPKEKQFTHIIWIVDESVRADLLQINNPNQQTMPFLMANKKYFVNYGIASSISNSSRASNILMQTGVRQNELPDYSFKYVSNPSIFQYGKKAGYTTCFIDGQNRSVRPQNNMSKYDLIYIDQYIQILKKYPSMKLIEIDHTIVDYIDTLINSTESSFIYVNKEGCHFSYKNRCPDNKIKFSPYYKLKEILTDKEILINTYKNCVYWNVDAFFEKLLPKIIHKDVLVFYTSDHGECLMDKGSYIGHNTYSNPHSIEAAVPFIVFGSEGFQNSELFSNAEFNFNKISHFQLFPSTLTLMGYEKNEVTEKYGKIIFDKIENENRQFMTGVIYRPWWCSMHSFKANEINSDNRK